MAKPLKVHLFCERCVNDTKAISTKELGLGHPVFQAPMVGGLISPNFVAQIYKSSRLGSIPGAYLDLEQINKFIIEVKKTSRVFLLHLLVGYNHYSHTLLSKPKEIIAAEKNYIYTAIDEWIDLAMTHNVPIISTTFDLLSLQHVEALKAMTTVNPIF